MISSRAKQSTGMAWPALHLAVVLFGLSGLFGKLLALPALVIVVGRTAIAAMTLGIAQLIRGRSFRVPRSSLPLFALLGLLLAIHWVTFFYSIQISNIAIGLVSFSSFPIFVTLLEPLCFRERLSSRNVLLALAVFGGLALVTPSCDLSDQLTQGVLWGVLSGFTFALLTLLNRVGAQKYAPVTTAMWQNLFAALILAPFTLPISVVLSWRDLALLLGLGVICTALAHTLFIYALQTIKAQIASIVNALEPIYGVLFGYLLLNEIPAVKTAIGGVIIVGAAVIAARSRPTAKLSGENPYKAASYTSPIARTLPDSIARSTRITGALHTDATVCEYRRVS